MEKKFLLCAVSLILIAGESYSSDPNPNSFSFSFSNPNPNPDSFSFSFSEPKPKPKTKPKGSTSSGRVVTRPPVPTAPKVTAPKVTAPKVFKTLQKVTGILPHIVLRAEQPREVENISMNGSRSVSEPVVRQLEQIVKPEYVVDTTGSVGNVEVTVVPRTANVIDDGATTAKLKPGELMWITHRTLLDLPNKIIPGSRIEFDVADKTPRNLRFYPPKQSRSSASNPNSVSQTAAPHPLPITAGADNTGAAGAVASPSAAVEAGAGAGAPSTAAVDELPPIDFDLPTTPTVDETPLIDFNLPAASTATAAAPTAYAREILDPSFWSNAPAPVSQTATVGADEVAAGADAPATSTGK